MSEARFPPRAYSNEESDLVPRDRRNLRRPYDREGREIWPMDLANAAERALRKVLSQA